MVAPIYVANNMIKRAREQTVELTNLKLQKLLYLLYAKYYAVSGDALFTNRFEAWAYGPVLSDIYKVFKAEGAGPIKDYRSDANGRVLIVCETGEFGESFDHIWGNYARKSAGYLVDMTHGKVESDGWDTAWRKTINEKGIGAFIDDEYIKEDGEKWFGRRAS